MNAGNFREAQDGRCFFEEIKYVPLISRVRNALHRWQVPGDKDGDEATMIYSKSVEQNLISPLKGT